MYFTAAQISKEYLCKKELLDDYSFRHIADAIENITEYKIIRQMKPIVYLEDVILEIKQMSMFWKDKEDIVVVLEKEQNAQFACQWLLTKYAFGQAGYKLIA